MLQTRALPNGRPSRALLRLVRTYRAADPVGRRTIELALEEAARAGARWAGKARAGRAADTPEARRAGVEAWLRELDAIARVEVLRPAAEPERSDL